MGGNLYKRNRPNRQPKPKLTRTEPRLIDRYLTMTPSLRTTIPQAVPRG